MPTPSLVSDCPSGASPSMVAKSPSMFRDWMIGAQVFKIEAGPSEDVTNHFDKLYQLKEVPKTLTQVPLPTPYLDSESEFQLAVHAWASTLSSVEGDEHGILTALPHLAFAYDHVRKTLNNHSEEHSQRRSIDDIIELGFSARIDRRCDFKTEQSYCLVGLAGNPDAQSDALVTIPSTAVGNKIRMAQLSSSFRGDPSILRQLYWSTGGETDNFSIIGFAGEFKKDDNECNQNQLIMVLATAQAQRKALSLVPSIIMGATACCGCVKIFSSYWTDDNLLVCIYEHEQQFDLSDPIQILRLYVFCSRLEKHFQSTLVSELNTWNIPDMATLQSCMWRSPDHSTKKYCWTEAGESGNESSGGREGDNNDPMEADGVNDDWYMNLMKWRDEAVKDGIWPQAGYGLEGELLLLCHNLTF